MSFARSIGLGVLLACLQGLLENVAISKELPPPWEKAVVHHKIPHAIDWEAAWHAVFDLDDPVIIYQLYTHAGRHKVTFPTGNVELRFTLSREGTEILQKDFRLPGNQIYSGLHSEVDSDARFAVFQIKCRDVFGSLRAGNFAISVAVRSDSIRLDSLKLSESEWLEGPVCRQKIVEFKPDQIADSPSHDVVIDADLSKLNVDGIYCFASIKNNDKNSLSVYAYTNGQPVAPSDHILCPCGLQVYVPDFGWFGDAALGLCGTGLGELAISSGNTQAVRLWTSVPKEGVYRFDVSLMQPGDKERQPIRAYSRGFMMQRGSPRFLPGANMK